MPGEHCTHIPSSPNKQTSGKFGLIHREVYDSHEYKGNQRLIPQSGQTTHHSELRCSIMAGIYKSGNGPMVTT